jgi:hypothetical protein
MYPKVWLHCGSPGYLPSHQPPTVRLDTTTKPQLAEPRTRKHVIYPYASCQVCDGETLIASQTGGNVRFDPDRGSR